MTTGSIIPGSGVRMLNKGLVTFPSNNKSGNRERTETEWLVGVRVRVDSVSGQVRVSVNSKPNPNLTLKLITRFQSSRGFRSYWDPIYRHLVTTNLVSESEIRPNLHISFDFYGKQHWYNPLSNKTYLLGTYDIRIFGVLSAHPNQCLPYCTLYITLQTGHCSHLSVQHNETNNFNYSILFHFNNNIRAWQIYFLFRYSMESHSVA